MHCSVIEHGYDVIEFSNCSTEERGVSRVLLCSLKMKLFENEIVKLLRSDKTGRHRNELSLPGYDDIHQVTSLNFKSSYGTR